MIKKHALRRGTSNWGREYETNMLALFSLRIVRHCTQDFWLAFNVDGAGAFDDIILRLGNHTTFMLQLKHKENPTGRIIRKNQLLTKKKKEFYLEDYIKDICHLRTKLNLSNTSNTGTDITNELGSFNQIYFILYTNIPDTESCNFLTLRNANGYLSYLTSKADSKIYQIDVANVSRRFDLNNVDGIKHFYLFCNEISAKDVPDKIEEEIKEITGCSDSKTICFDYMRFITDWSRGNSTGSNYCLRRSDVVLKLIELSLKKYEMKIFEQPYTFYESGQKCVWNRIIEDKTVTVIDVNPYNSALISNFSFEYIGSEVEKYCKGMGKANWSDGLSQADELLFDGKSAKFELEDLKSVGSCTKITLYDVYKYLWTLRQLPLLLEINNQEDYDRVFRLLKLSNYFYKIIIFNKSETSLTLNKEVAHFENLENLNCEEKEEILKQPVRFQGRFGAELEVLVEKNMYPKIKTVDIVNILLNNYNIAKELESVPKYYIPRKFRNPISDSIVPAEYSALSNWRTSLISADPGMGKSMLMDYIAQEVPTNKWVIKIDLKRHHNYYDDFRKTRNQITALEHLNYFKDPNKLNNELENEIYENLQKSKNLVILVDGFDEIAITYKKEVTTIVKSFYNENFSICLTTRPIEKSHLENEFGVSALELLRFNKDDQQKFLIEYFNEDEENLNYNEEESDKSVEKLLNSFKTDFTAIPLHIKMLAEVLSDDNKINLGNINSHKEFDLLDLYGTYIIKKDNILRNKYGFNDSYTLYKDYQSLLAFRSLFSSLNRFITEYDWKFYIIEEFQSVYGKIDNNHIRLLEKGGILTVDDKFNVNFTHQTFAEYLAAEWLFKNLNNENEKVKNIVRYAYGAFNGLYRLNTKHYPFLINFKNLNNENEKVKNIVSYAYGTFNGLYRSDTKHYPFLLNVFDRLLLKDSLPNNDFYRLCLSVMNGQVDEIKRLFNFHPINLDTADGAKRSLLHLAVIYRSQFGSLTDVFSEIIQNTLEIDEDVFGYNPIDYAFKFKFYEWANMMCKKWPNTKISIYKCETELVLGHMLEYPYLENAVLPYLAYREIMFKRVKECETIVSCISRYLIYVVNAKYKKMEISQLSNFEEHKNLCYEVVFGTTDVVRKMLRTNDQVNRRDANGYAPLHYSVYHDKTDMIDLLLKNGNVDIRTYDGDTPLHISVKKGNLAAFSKLLSKCNINTEDMYGNTALYYAIIFKRLQMINLLLSNGANVNTQHFRVDDTLLQFLVLCSDIKRPDFYPYQLDHLNVTDVKYTEEEAIEVADLLISKAADINIQNCHGDTPLHYSAVYGTSKIVEKFLFHGAVVNIVDNEGNTPLHLALRAYNDNSTSYVEIIKLLLAKGADTNTKNNEGYTPFYYGIKRGDFKLIENLILSKADVNLKDNFGNTPLHQAILKRRDLDITRLLLSSGALVNLRNSAGKTPLLYSVEKSTCEIVRHLILNGADVNKKDNDGNSALHQAIFFVGYENKDSAAEDTTDDLAITTRKKLDIINLLLSNGVNVNITNARKETPLHVGVAYNNYRVVEMLIRHKANINAKDVLGNTPLHYSHKFYANSNTRVLNLLLSSGAHRNIKNVEGKRFCDDYTPLPTYKILQGQN